MSQKRAFTLTITNGNQGRLAAANAVEMAAEAKEDRFAARMRARAHLAATYAGLLGIAQLRLARAQQDPGLRVRPEAAAAVLRVDDDDRVALIIADQPVVVVSRGGQPEEALQDHMDLRCIKEVGTADDIGDPLGCVVHHDGQMVGAHEILARQDDVTDL